MVIIIIVFNGYKKTGASAGNTVNSSITPTLEANMSDGKHIALEILSKQKGTMRTHTLFLDQVDFENKKRTLSPTLDELNNSPSKTSEMDGLSVLSNSNNTINLPKSQTASLLLF